MIINNQKTLSQTDNIGRTAKATIKASARLFSFFSDQIYSNSYVAIWRELVANGMDAQVVAGRSDKPVIVTLPTDYTPYAKVRDFGTGMSELFLIGDENTPSKFMAFTDASTKENSNDFIGGFGIGSKAPLSYTEQFGIHSYQDGVCKIYSVYKDEDGSPCIAKLAEHPTDEPDGVEISFPVEGKDIRAFRDAAPETLRYFNPLPELVNAAEQITPPDYTFSTKTWGLLRNAVNSRVVQGGIAYPITQGAVREIDEVLGFGIDFFVPIGSCSIALSREQLNYDDSTVRVLKSIVDAIKPELQAHISKMFENCKTRWEAESLYHREVNTGSAMRRRLVREHAVFNGIKLCGRIRPPGVLVDKVSVAQVTTARYNRTNYSYWTEGTSNPTFRAWMMDVYPKDISVILIDDKPTKPVLRMRNYLESNDLNKQGVMIIRPHTGVEISKMQWGRLLVALGRPPFKLLSEIEPAVVTRNGVVTPVRKIVRGYKSNASFKCPTIGNDYVDGVPDSGYYMVMNGFKLLDGQANQRQLVASGMDNNNLFWFNAKDFEGIKDNPKWRPAIDLYNEKLVTYKASHKNMALAEAFAVLAADQHSYTGDKSYRWVDLVGMLGDDLPKQGPLYQLNKLYSSIVSELTNVDRTMRQLLEVDCKAQLHTIRTLVDQAKAKYPEVSQLLHFRNIGPNPELKPVYLKLI